MLGSETLREQQGLAGLMGHSMEFQKEVEKIPLIAKTVANVLISGETGTGKELFARAIHYLSDRADKPFIPINCGAIPQELMESELFGHEQGAFTGATSRKPGLVKEADGGTLFLDEIDSLSSLAQVKLLRFLQDKEYRPVGSTKSEQTDVRVIAATNMDVDVALKTGRIRRDLYYRLNVTSFVLPPLRKRQCDIPILANYFLSKYNTEFKRTISGISDDAMQKLVRYDWPGNVRELENVVERAIVLEEGAFIQSQTIAIEGADSDAAATLSFKEMKQRIVGQFERTFLHDLLVEHGGNISRAAAAAKKNRRALLQLIYKHKIDVHSIRSERKHEMISV